ncbi:hypothetical protein [Sphingomonas sp.]|uniref:hypothetical protein n=1 Tax=Sphingomonas sp. TaxID=28214 RepID=UPI0025F6F10F|nr:hypothetical protein [Sphingomonas sp.]MBV9528329.1 hypothetical protein [Sphingomonas sp.]
MSKVTAIPVIDGNGDHVTIYQFEDRRFIRHVRRFKLDTGDAVERIDDETFVLANGETLRRLRRG